MHILVIFSQKYITTVIIFFKKIRLQADFGEDLSLNGLCGFNTVMSRLEAIYRGDALASFQMTMMGQSNRKVLIGMPFFYFLGTNHHQHSHYFIRVLPKVEYQDSISEIKVLKPFSIRQQRSLK